MVWAELIANPFGLGLPEPVLPVLITSVLVADDLGAPEKATTP